MRTARLLRACTLVPAGLLSAPAAAIAGDLDPPAGPVAPTMKTLDQVEPRTPLDPADVPIVISEPGSYLLTGGIVAQQSGGAAITINVSNVSLDLGGFAITQGDPPNAFTNLILVSAGVESVSISNGRLRGATSDGVRTAGATFVRLSDLSMANCGGDGFDVGEFTILERCTSTDNFRDGFQATLDCVFRDCVAALNDGRGFDASASASLSGCTSRGNTEIGFNLGDGAVLENCIARANGAEAGFFLGATSIARGCVSQNNSGNGFDTDTIGAVVFEGCTALSNGGDGFELSGPGCRVTDCTARLNDLAGFTGETAASISGGVAHGNGGHGFGITSGAGRIEHCTATGNGADGIRVHHSSQVTHCSATDNALIGIRVTGDHCRIDSCATANNASNVGLRIEGNRNVATSSLIGEPGGGICACGIVDSGSFNQIYGSSWIDADANPWRNW